MTQIRPLRILIAGGGIGGLSAAVALRLQGHEVEVFERSKLHTDLGNAVFCAPNCTAALSHLGIHPEETRGVLYRGVSESCKPKEAAPALKTRGCLQNKFMDESCNVSQARNITAEERAAWLAEWYLLTRRDLHDALKRKSLDLGVQIRTAAHVVSLDAAAASITLVDGSTVTGDLVVGADGIHSAVRASVLDREEPLTSSGHCCYRFLIPTADLLADPETRVFADQPGVFVQVAAPDRRLVFYPCSAGEVMNACGFVPRHEVGDIKKGLTGYDQSATKTQLMDHFRSFSPSVQRMLDLVPEDGVKLWDLMDMELQTSLIKGKAVLIGDAAHPFLPHFGQGAAQAIEDGCALGVVMSQGTSPGDIPQRLELWQKLRRDRAAKIVELTRHRARAADGSQGPPQTFEEFNAAIDYCNKHDAWKYAEEQIKTGEVGSVRP